MVLAWGRSGGSQSTCRLGGCLISRLDWGWGRGAYSRGCQLLAGNPSSCRLGLWGLTECPPSMVWWLASLRTMIGAGGLRWKEGERKHVHLCECMTPLEAEGSLAASAWKWHIFASATFHWSEEPTLVQRGRGLHHAGPPGGGGTGGHLQGWLLWSYSWWRRGWRFDLPSRPLWKAVS